MAENSKDYPNQQGQPLKKADLIIRLDREISSRTEEILKEVQAAGESVSEIDEKVSSVLEKLGGLDNTDINHEIERIVVQGEAISHVVKEECNSLKNELKYLAMQNESIFNSVSEKVKELENLVGKSEPVSSGQPEETEAAERVAEIPAEIDYDLLADKIAERIPAQTVVAAPAEIQPAVQTEPIDYDLLVDKLVARMPAQEVVTAAPAQAAEAQIDYDLLAEKVANLMPAREVAVAAAVPVAEQNIDYEYLAQKVAAYMPAAAQAEFDIDALADKVVARFPIQESVSPDYIASRVAEQLVTPQSGGAEIDSDAIAEKVAEKIVVPQATAEVDNDYIAEKVIERINANTQTGNIDCEYIANRIAEQIVVPEPREQAFDYEYLAHRVSEQIVIPEPKYEGAVYANAPVANAEVDEDELADAIALKVGSLKPEDFEILVDDEGCNSISKVIVDKLDYELIANSVADKLRETLVELSTDEPDYEEMASRISENITVAGVNEDVIADKAAQVLSNYLPEFDTDEIADKVAAQVIDAMPAVDHDALTKNITDRLIESQQEADYDVVLDEDGIDKVSDSVSEKVYVTAEERFTAIDNEIAEIKAMLENGVVTVRDGETASAAAYDSYTTEESLVTVSDLLENYAEEAEGQVEEEPVEEPAEELPVEEEIIEEQPIEEEVAEEAAVEEQPAEEEIIEQPAETVAAEEVEEENDESEEGESDGEENEEGGEGGVDFANMMRYNRSFIARIIQSQDDIKRYYGEVRNALLSYKKVNSNIAWGAERFHKGRETIARFKIRGKTLVLYLALDPAAHEYSVYHHKDVSDNKSLHGTPMMIKIKSPRGVKKAVRLIDEMLEARDGVKRNVPQRDYAAMYPYESIEELIDDGLVKDVRK